MTIKVKHEKPRNKTIFLTVSESIHTCVITFLITMSYRLFKIGCSVVVLERVERLTGVLGFDLAMSFFFLRGPFLGGNGSSVRIRPS